MIERLTAIADGIDSLNRWIGKATRWLALLMLFILLYEIGSRWGFNAPTKWSVESLRYILAAYFLIGAGYTLLRGGHLRMDIFYSRWSCRTQAIVDLATFPVVAVYLIVVIWTGSEHALASLMRLEHSTSAWAPPVYPLKMIIPIAFSLLFLQVVAFLIRDIETILGKKK